MEYSAGNMAKREENMPRPVKEIIDLGHDYFTGMRNISGSAVAFWPVESHEGTRQISSGKLSMESRMMLIQLPGGQVLHYLRLVVRIVTVLTREGSVLQT